MPLNLDSLAPPISLRPAVSLSDEELMRFSAENKGYKIERNNRGDITIMSPVGGIGSDIIHSAVAADFNRPEHFVRTRLSVKRERSQYGYGGQSGECEGFA